MTTKEVERLVCQVCHEDRDLIDLVSSVQRRSNTTYYYTIHRACNTARIKKYRQRGGMAAQEQSNKKYEAKNPERRKAWIAARRIKLQPCEKCEATTHVHRHHPDVNDRLNVMFLCAKHHKEQHRIEAAYTKA